MTKKTKTIVVRDSFTRLLDAMRQHWTQPLAGKCVFDDEQLRSISTMADELGIQPEVKEVPDKPTDGELLAKAKGLAWEALGEATRSSLEAEADKFLRLVRDRDGEPLKVTEKLWEDWWHEACGKANATAAMISKINAHRGVRPEKPLPKVTPEIVGKAIDASWHEHSANEGMQIVADHINAELAKLAKDGE